MSVIIPVLNAESTIREQLEGLASQDYAGLWEVIVVDNGCTDDSIAIALDYASRLPDLGIVDARDGQGVSRARNAGVAAARGGFLAFCDADDVVTSGWLSALVHAGLQSDLVGGALDDVSLNDPTSVGWMHRPQVHELPESFGFLRFSLSCNLGIWADVCGAVGGWNDEYLHPGGEDVEFCWRAQLAGYRLSFAPSAVVRYRYRTTLKALMNQYYRYGFGGCHLYRDFHRRGVRRPPFLDLAKNWLWLPLNIYWVLLSPVKRGIWLRSVAFRWGRIRGSIIYRVLIP